MSDAAEIIVPVKGQAPYSVPITTPTRAALLSDLETRLTEGRGFAVATVNLDHMVKLQSSESFRAAYSRQSHVVADGNPVVWLARLSGRPVELVPGSELVEPVSALAGRLGVPIGFFGATEEALEGAAATLQARCPGLEVASRISPAYGFDPEGPVADAHIEEMAGLPARLWFLALGAPKQEVFAARAFERHPHLGFLSVGAGLDFLAGTQNRAPEAVQRMAGEWVWRMMRNPRRLGPRYARCMAVLPGLAFAALNRRGERQGS